MGRTVLLVVLCVVLGAAGALIATGQVNVGKSSTVNPQSTQATSQAEDPVVRISTEDAENVVIEAVEQATGYRPEVICPERIIGTLGSVFTCEALVRGQAQPVPLQVGIDTRLGVMRVLPTRRFERLTGRLVAESEESEALLECENFNLSPAGRRAEERCREEVAVQYGR